MPKYVTDEDYLVPNLTSGIRRLEPGPMAKHVHLLQLKVGSK